MPEWINEAREWRINRKLIKSKTYMDTEEKDRGILGKKERTERKITWKLPIKNEKENRERIQKIKIKIKCLKLRKEGRKKPEHQKSPLAYLPSVVRFLRLEARMDDGKTTDWVPWQMGGRKLHSVSFGYGLLALVVMEKEISPAHGVKGTLLQKRMSSNPRSVLFPLCETVYTRLSHI